MAGQGSGRRSMENQGVWLGSLRGPVKMIMFGFMGLTAIVALILIVPHLIGAGTIGMYEMLRPEGHPMVYLMLGSLALAMLFAAIYLSDFVGAIEPKPDGFFDILSLVLSRIAMISIAWIVIVMFYEVIARYVFSKPTLWANELSLWIAGFVFLFAGLYAMQQRSHIRIYIIYDIMPRWAQKAADVISVLLIWVFTVALVWGAYNEARDKFLRMETFGTAWDPPLPATIKPAILILISMVAIQALSNLIADWNKAPESHTPMDEIDEVEIENIRKTLGDN
jgi:TRAP-type C4-dicarboxylate transport system permease small subunit